MTDLLQLLMSILDIFSSASETAESGKRNYDRGCVITLGLVFCVALFFGALLYFGG